MSREADLEWNGEQWIGAIHERGESVCDLCHSPSGFHVIGCERLELTKGLRERIAALERENAELRAALEHFAYPFNWMQAKQAHDRENHFVWVMVIPPQEIARAALAAK